MTASSLTSRLLSLIARVLLIGLLVIPASMARAQGSDVTPYYVVSKGGEVKIRCGNGTPWYPVGSVKTGHALRVDGQDGDWLRVAYPAGLAAVVSTQEADYRQAEGMVVLTRASSLRAANAGDASIEECYKAVFLDKLAIGVQMRYLGPVNDHAGKLQGYKVEAPPGAKGWVAAAEVRRATDAEAAKVATVSNPAPAHPAVATPAPATANPAVAKPAAPTATPPNATPPAGQPTAQPVPVPVNTAPAAHPDPNAAPAPVGAEPGAAPPPETITNPVPEVVEPPKPREPTAEEIRAREIAEVYSKRTKQLHQLDDAFRVVSAQPVESAEFTPLIEEYRKFKESLGSDPANARTAAYVDARVELLRLRVELQEKHQKMTALQSRFKQLNDDLANRIAEIQRTKEYMVVGRLVTSAMYDGNRLPLLYRLISVDASVGRTLAYITPEASLGLDSKLNMIVGIKGDGPYDPAAKVNIITPSAVDILRSADGSPLEAAAPPKPLLESPQPAEAKPVGDSNK